MSWTDEKEQETQRRVNLIRNCLHRKAHYADEGGNRRCFQCEGMVREIPGVPMLRVETRTLTDGWVVSGAWYHIRRMEEQARSELGLPPLPEPVVKDQQRYVTDWVDA